MVHRNPDHRDITYPILEFDPTREALIEPSKTIHRRDVPEHCVICFFKEVLEKVISECSAHIIVDNRWEDGPHPLYEIDFGGRRLAFFHPGIGSPFSASLLEEVITFGCSKFIACGGAGVLIKDTVVGNLIVVKSAVRDEGVSYHYLPPAREVIADLAGLNALVKTMERRSIPYRLGKTWTIDAPYRETPKRIARVGEDCLTVEMECAGMMAVAQYRQVVFGQVLYAGDDLSGEAWDHRGWQSRKEIHADRPRCRRG